jgi:hypothetical protein
MNSAQKIGVIVAFAIGAVSFPLAKGMFSASGTGPRIIDSTGSDHIDDLIARNCDEMNKSLPLKLDPWTRWDSASPDKNRTIVYKYTVLGMSASEARNRGLASKIRPTLVHNYKTHPAMRDLRDASVTLRYSYFDESGASVANIEISPSDL